MYVLCLLRGFLCFGQSGPRTRLCGDLAYVFLAAANTLEQFTAQEGRFLRDSFCRDLVDHVPLCNRCYRNARAPPRYYVIHNSPATVKGVFWGSYLSVVIQITELVQEMDGCTLY